MTLDTRVYVTSPVLKPREVFDYCNALLAAEKGWPVERIRFRENDTAEIRWHNDPGWHNEMDQGLCALMDVKYGADGPLKRDCTCDEDRDLEDGPEWKCWYCRKPVTFVEISFNTAYSFRRGSLGCGDLHAALVATLGAWLDSRGYEWFWENEFTGEIHKGATQLEGLRSGGASAESWFRSDALPAILAHSGGAV